MSGSSLEKPLVSAFKGNNSIYVILDNEINGTMGLPIILVSKLENTFSSPSKKAHLFSLSPFKVLKVDDLTSSRTQSWR